MMGIKERKGILKNEKGTATVEFAIISPLLFVLLFGIMEFGILFYNKAVITNACRVGARYGIVARQPRRTDAEIKNEVVEALNGTTNGAYLISFGGQLSSNNVTVARLNGTTNFGDDLQVRVQWDHAFLVIPNLSGLLGDDKLSDSWPIGSTTVMKYE